MPRMPTPCGFSGRTTPGYDSVGVAFARDLIRPAVRAQFNNLASRNVLDRHFVQRLTFFEHHRSVVGHGLDIPEGPLDPVHEYFEARCRFLAHIQAITDSPNLELGEEQEMKDTKELRKALAEHLEAALALADELNEGTVGFTVETALDLLSLR